jgi:hypothetical protein
MDTAAAVSSWLQRKQDTHRDSIVARHLRQAGACRTHEPISFDISIVLTCKFAGENRSRRRLKQTRA